MSKLVIEANIQDIIAYQFHKLLKNNKSSVSSYITATQIIEKFPCELQINLFTDLKELGARWKISNNHIHCIFGIQMKRKNDFFNSFGGNIASEFQQPIILEQLCIGTGID